MFFAQLLLCLLALICYEITQGMRLEMIVLWNILPRVPKMAYFIYDPPSFLERTKAARLGSLSIVQMTGFNQVMQYS